MKLNLKINKLFFCSVLALTAILLSLSSCSTSDKDQPNPDPKPQEPDDDGNPDENDQTLSYLFKPGDNGYSCFRIPAITKTKDGTLLAFAEARKNGCGDEGDIDMVVRRSTDNGKTWGNMILIWSDGDNTCGNPSPVVDVVTGRVHLLMSWNLGTDRLASINNGTSKDTRRAFYTYSDDDGKTWKDAKEITSDVKMPAWGWYATGPGHGIQLSTGQHKGRLLVPCDYIEVGTGRRGFSHVIYSDDNGENWQLGGVSPVHANNPNESTLAELSTGEVMLNMRNSSHNRLVSISQDAGMSFSNINLDYTLIDPGCQASLLSTTVEGKHTLFFSNPSSAERENMTIKMSTTDGKTWGKRYNVYKGPSAYSDIVLHNQQEISILYEAGKAGPYEGIAYKSIPLKSFY